MDGQVATRRDVLLDPGRASPEGVRPVEVIVAEERLHCGRVADAGPGGGRGVLGMVGDVKVAGPLAGGHVHGTAPNSTPSSDRLRYMKSGLVQFHRFFKALIPDLHKDISRQKMDERHPISSFP